MWCSKIAVNNTISSIINMWCSKLRGDWVGKAVIMDGCGGFPTGEFDEMVDQSLIIVLLSRVVGQLFFPRR